MVFINFSPNAALSGALEGHPSPVPGSPRSVAEGRDRHYRSAPRSPRSEAEGGTTKVSGGCRPSAGVICYAIEIDALFYALVNCYARKYFHNICVFDHIKIARGQVAS